MSGEFLRSFDYSVIKRDLILQLPTDVLWRGSLLSGMLFSGMVKYYEGRRNQLYEVIPYARADRNREHFRQHQA